MKKIGMLLLMVPLAAPVPAAAMSSTYTEVSACGGHDTQNDEFIYNCKGPAGLAAALHYVEGKAFVVFGKGGGKDGDEIIGKTFNPVKPIPLGHSGKVFGSKIEWLRSDGGKVCAAIVRVETDKGSRLVMTALAGDVGRVVLSKTNEQARASARKACGSSAANTTKSDEANVALATKATEISGIPSTSAKDLLPLKQGIFVDSEIPCKEFGRAYLTKLHVANKYAMSFWGDSVNDAFTIGKITKVKREGKTYNVTLDSKTDSPMGSAEGVYEQAFVISSPTRLRTDRGYGQATFRWCYNEIP